MDKEMLRKVMLIEWARTGVKIDKEEETQESYTIYISVPEHSYRNMADGTEMSGKTLAKRFKDVLVEMGIKRLTIKARTIKGLNWTKDMGETAALNMRKKLYGSQY